MTRSLLVFLFISLHLCGKGKSDSITFIKNLPLYSLEQNVDPAVAITAPWYFMKGDNPAWADSAFNDSQWMLMDPAMDTLRITPGLFGEIGWFRTRVNVAPEYAGKVLALMITQSGASEIYIDGKKIHEFGRIVPKNPNDEVRYDPQLLPIPVTFPSAGIHVIAVRYAHAHAEEDAASGLSAPGFNMKIGDFWSCNVFRAVNHGILTTIFTFYFTFFLALSFLHFIIWLFYRSKRSNLFYSIFALGFGMIFLCMLSSQSIMDPDTTATTRFINGLLSDIYGPALIAMLYSIFYGRMLKVFWVWLALYAIDFTLTLVNIEVPYLGIVTFLIFCVESIRVIVAAIIKKKEGAWMIGSGVMITAFFLIGFVLLAATGTAEFIYMQRGVTGLIVAVVVIYITLSIPIHMSAYLARDFARTNRKLEKKLVEVEELSQKSVQQEKEKQKILAEQNDLLESQVKERTAEVVEQKKVIEEKNKDITDSIQYARKIQESMLPSTALVNRLFPENFILYKPKDIVSGDFYWIAENADRRFIAAVDCTGHGVPGALMSMTGNNFLNQIVNERNISSPKEILVQLNAEIRKSLRQDQAETESKDGMDIALCSFSSDFKSVTYAGANRPLWLVRNGQLQEFKPVKQSIGGMLSSLQFEEVTIALQTGDCIYIFSDGYADQFGGPEGKKFMSRKLKELVSSINKSSPNEQRTELESAIAKWKGSLTQVDDILVIGIRV